MPNNDKLYCQFQSLPKKFKKELEPKKKKKKKLKPNQKLS